MDSVWGVNATTEDAMAGKGRFSHEALTKNFHTHESEFESLRMMIMRDAIRYQSISATGENGEAPVSISLGTTATPVQEDLQRKYIRALKDLGITSVSVTKGDKDLDFQVASWGLSVAGGSLSYFYSKKKPKDVHGECCVTDYETLGAGWYLRDEGH
jgi:hypothetical protein